MTWIRTGLTVAAAGLAAGCGSAAPPSESGPAKHSGRFSESEISYLAEVALGSEYGPQVQRVRKWARPVKLGVLGRPTRADLVFLGGVIARINDLQNAVPLSFAESEPYDIYLHVVPRAEFSRIDPNCPDTDPSFFWLWWTTEFELDEARILISSDDSQAQREAYILEEVVQAMGLPSSPDTHPDSVFADLRNSHLRALAPIDRRLLTMLYRAEVLPGQTREELIRTLRAL